jgi:RNA-directed DNA polymerase
MTPASQQSRPPLTTKAELAETLGTPLRKLNYWFHVLPADRRYTRFELQRSGDRAPRVIEAPIRPIKDIQRRVLAIISAYYTAPRAVHGYIAGRSIITNARVHLHQRWVFHIDLADFFPSINFGRVRGRFMASPFRFPPDVATLLAQICCHNNHLPQGAPTSPLVSNLICRRLDRQLGELAKADRCFYSRYCDDLVFSTTRRAFPVALATTDIQTGAIVAAPPVRAVISSNGFTINESKTRLRHYSQRQVVTGLVTNQILNVPRDYVRSLRSLLHIWKSHGEAAAAAALVRHRPENRAPNRASADFRLVVRGKVQYLGSVKGWDDSVYTALAWISTEA